VLPLARWRQSRIALAGGVCVVVALVATWIGLDDVANLAKLGAATAVGFLFVSVFEQASWLLLVALVIPFADTWSVWQGPTRKIVTKAPAVFDVSSVALPLPGTRVVIMEWDEVPGAQDYVVTAGREGRAAQSFDLDRERSVGIGISTHRAYTFSVAARAGSQRLGRAVLACRPACAKLGVTAASGARLGVRARTRLGYDRLGLTDVVFFALFLAGAMRFGLRVRWTWVGLVAGIAATGALGVVDPFGIGGVPALPLISLGFLLPNADLFWSRRGGRGD
jgi:hypothetical protein